MWHSDSCFRAHNVSFKGSADLSLFVWILKPFDIKKNHTKVIIITSGQGWKAGKKLGDSNPLHWPFFYDLGLKNKVGNGVKTGIRTILTFWGIKKELLSYQPFFLFWKKLNRTILAFVYLLFFIKLKSLPKKTIRFLRFSSNYIMDRLFPLWIGLILFVFNYYNYWRKHWFSLHSPSMLCFGRISKEGN